MDTAFPEMGNTVAVLNDNVSNGHWMISEDDLIDLIPQWTTAELPIILNTCLLMI